MRIVLLVKCQIRRRLKNMKIRTIITAAATGCLLAIAGSSLTFGAQWVCPRGYADCEGYEYCQTHDHGDCDGYWNEDGDFICPDGTHSYCHSSASATAPTGGRSSGSCSSRSDSSKPGTSRSGSSGTRGYGHHGGCGSHHRS